MSDDKSACAKCGQVWSEHVGDGHDEPICPDPPAPAPKCACGRDFDKCDHEGDGCTRAPAPEGAAVLTREEFADALTNLPYGDCAARERQILAHDAALRAEVEHHQNTIESLILQRDKAEAEVRHHEERIKDYENEPGWREIVEARVAPLRAANERLRPLAAFGTKLLTEFYNDGEPGDLDGGWIQDTAIEAGLLVHPDVAHDPGDCECCADEPRSCYVIAAAAIKEASHE